MKLLKNSLALLSLMSLTAFAGSKSIKIDIPNHECGDNLSSKNLRKVYDTLYHEGKKEFVRIYNAATSNELKVENFQFPQNIKIWRESVLVRGYFDYVKYRNKNIDDEFVFRFSIDTEDEKIVIKVPGKKNINLSASYKFSNVNKDESYYRLSLNKEYGLNGELLETSNKYCTLSQPIVFTRVYNVINSDTNKPIIEEEVYAYSNGEVEQDYLHFFSEEI